MRDEQIIPTGWSGQRGGGNSNLSGGVVSHGVDAREVVEAKENGDGDGSGAI